MYDVESVEQIGSYAVVDEAERIEPLGGDDTPEMRRALREGLRTQPDSAKTGTTWDVALE